MRPRWLLSAMTLDEVRAKMPCKRCGALAKLTPVDRREDERLLKAHSYPDWSR